MGARRPMHALRPRHPHYRKRCPGSVLVAMGFLVVPRVLVLVRLRFVPGAFVAMRVAVHVFVLVRVRHSIMHMFVRVAVDVFMRVAFRGFLEDDPVIDQGHFPDAAPYRVPVAKNVLEAPDVLALGPDGVHRFHEQPLFPVDDQIRIGFTHCTPPGPAAVPRGPFRAMPCYMSNLISPYTVVPAGMDPPQYSGSSNMLFHATEASTCSVALKVNFVSQLQCGANPE